MQEVRNQEEKEEEEQEEQEGEGVGTGRGREEGSTQGEAGMCKLKEQAFFPSTRRPDILLLTFSC